MRASALELEFAEMDKPRRKKVQVKWLNLYLLIWADETCVPTGLIKLAYLPSATINGVVGLPTSVLMGILE